jgi:poly(glycerol-phosphate) alpha-glucosyltransferase
VAWIPYGVYPGSSPPATQANGGRAPLRLLYAGRLTDSQKRASDLIRLAEHLRGVLPEYRLDIVGDGPLLPDFRQRLKPEIADGRVVLHGWVERPVLHQLLDDSDLFLLTSDSEGFPIALIEAMSHGLAPVVTDIESGNRQLVRHMQNGILVPVAGIGDFVREIRLLAGDRSLLHSLRVSAWHSAQQYTMERMLDAYIECFSAAKEKACLRPRTPNPVFPLMQRCRSRYPLWLRRVKVSVKRKGQRDKGAKG